MDEFVIKSEKEVTLTFHSRRFNFDGWLDTYSVSAKARNFNALIEVENPPYGLSPAGFFGGLANEWSGWKGEKGWGAIEGEYNLLATSDSLGHITLVAELNLNDVVPGWSGSVSLIVEAGQLEQLAHDAKEFFNEKA
ncbi:DUF6228 family protein [Noviherbaspirillum massiliense]|uniref:DUF6228 family protein n=1 Tax=Noviherbaspirillum massiliense TaxID=1465823 RepID=UPI0003635543|nr:DUF6228 family protein [Noviherbaspirillum massiliense]